jgi:regulator of replication initiation timing
LTTENARLNWEIDRWTWEIRGATAELKRLRGQTTSQDRTITTLCQENQHLRPEFDNCRDQICRERETMSVAARNLDNAQLQITSLQKEIEGLRSCLDSGLDQNDQLKEEVQSLQARAREDEADPGRWSSTRPRVRPRDSRSTIPRFHPYRQDTGPTSSYNIRAERGSTSFAESSRQPGVPDPARDFSQQSEPQGSRPPTAAEQN